MKKITKIFTLLLFGLILGLVVTGCGPKETTYKVTFDLNYEGALNGPSAQEVKDGEKPVAPLEPARDGYIFKGWFDQKEGGEEYRFNVGITKDLVLYARWEDESEDGLPAYYLGGSFNSYNEKHQDYKMVPVEGEEGIYELVVELTEENRDKAYDGHYYKVTNGTWDADGCWGVDNYYIDPAPVSPTGGGMGSIWHWANGTLTIRWDSVEKEITDTLVMDEQIIQDVYSIYGKFNSWTLEGEGALELQDFDGDGIYTGEYEFKTAVESDFIVVVSKLWWDDQWGQRWGAHEQYQFDGTVAGMGASAEIELEAGHYIFSYDSVTKLTTYMQVEDGTVYNFAYPRIYGEFNGWKHDNHEDVVALYNVPGDIYFYAEIVFEEAIESDFTILLAQKFYDDEWGKRWGADLQYKLDGTPAGMGSTSQLDLEAGRYLFIYNSETHVTTHVKVEANTIYEFNHPRMYGEFNGWSLSSHLTGVALLNIPGDIIYQVELEFEEAVESDFTIVLSQKFYDDEWGQRWGAEEQYKFDGEAAGMGGTTNLVLEPGRYLFTFNSVTKVTTYLKIEADAIYEFNTPHVYGAFNTWSIEGPNGIVLTENSEGKFTTEVTFEEETTTDMITVLSKKYYDDEWGQRWGAEEQYNLEGKAISEGNPSVTYEAGTYILVFDPVTKTLTVTKK